MTHTRLFAIILLIGAVVPGCRQVQKEQSDASSESPPADNITADADDVTTTEVVPPEAAVNQVRPEAAVAQDAASSSREPGPCCEESQATGCTDQDVMNCVCAQNEQCCTQRWSGFCVALVEELDCGSCDQRCCEEEWDELCSALVESKGCGTCGPSNDCCIARADSGCNDPEIESCVCAQYPDCCSDVWSGFCVLLVEEEACGECSLKRDCCSANSYPGCDNPEVESCVCAQYPACCEKAWTDYCVLLVDTLSCGSCSPKGDCCSANESPGCADPAIESCVCG